MVKLCFSLSYQFRCGYFLFAQCVGVALLDLKFLSEETFVYVAVDSVCLWQKVSSGTFYVIIWNLFSCHTAKYRVVARSLACPTGTVI